MLFLPDIYTSDPEGQGSVYLLSHPLSQVRIHCVMSEDGTARPGLFVGGAYFRLQI